MDMFPDPKKYHEFIMLVSNISRGEKLDFGAVIRFRSELDFKWINFMFWILMRKNKHRYVIDRDNNYIWVGNADERLTTERWINATPFLPETLIVVPQLLDFLKEWKSFEEWLHSVPSLTESIEP